MLNVFQWLLKLLKKHKKLRAFHRIFLELTIRKSFIFLLTFFKFVANAPTSKRYITDQLWWMLLIQRMHQLPRNMLLHSQAPFRCTKITVLNIWGTLSYLLLKSTNEKTFFFFTEFSCRLLYRKYDVPTVETYAANFLRNS